MASTNEGAELDVAELRRGFVSDDDSVVAIIDGGEEETSSLLESGRKVGGQVDSTASNEGKAYRALKTLMAVVAVIVVATFAVAGGGYYATSTSGDSLSSVDTDVAIKLSDTLGQTPTWEPTRAPNAMSYITDTDDVSYTKMSETEQKELFDLFISIYSKTYDDDEDTMSRFSKFKNNLI